MRQLLFFCILLLVFSCASKPAFIQFETATGATKYKEKPGRHGFRYTVPAEMEESARANRYNLRNLLVYKDTSYYSSPMVIAIRNTKDWMDYSIAKFAQNDQSLLRDRVRITYENTSWEPAGLKEKNIDYARFQFYYYYGRVKIYQRSVYIRCDDAYYVVSMSSKNKLFIIDKTNDFFWNSIRID